MQFATSTRDLGDRLLIEIRGTIDLYTAPQLRVELIDALDAGYVHLVLDLDNVEFLDSTGIGVLVGALKRVRAAQGSLQVIASTDVVLRPLRVTGLHKVFTVRPSLDRAVTGRG